MKMKRYALVRVDDKCPLVTEDNFYCSEYLQKDKCEKCKEIRGDTKAQLKMKIATAIKQSLKKSESNNFKAKVLAGIIVEFLGV